MIDLVTSLVSKKVNYRTIRPIAASCLHGITARGDKLLAIDTRNGYLLEIDPINDNTIILNSHNWEDFIGTTGLAVSGDTLWFTNGQEVYYCSLGSHEWKPELFIRLSYPVNGIAIWESTIYLTCQKTGYILIFSKDTGKQIRQFHSPGIGLENITVKGETIWVSDNLEQTVYCLDRATGEILFNVLTPFPSPTGLTFYYNSQQQEEILYVSYADQEPCIEDNPNREPNYELNFRDRTFIHPLYFYYDVENRYALSNGYLIEISYVEEIAPLDPVELEDLEWRIALPSDTNRQKVRSVQSIGLPFTEEIIDGQRVAVFKFENFNSNQRYIFGWRVLLEVWSIKYQLSPKDCEKLPELSPELKQRYLLDDDELSMHTEIVQRAAQESVGRETNLLRKIYNIRNYVYDQLSYEIKPYINTPDIVLKRGVGSCGEYLGVLLALARLNGIACRTVGRYKCPLRVLEFDIPLIPQYNHVWMEFYLPGFGWLPMESNPDDINEGGPYPRRFFMGLSWYHAEMAKGIPFESLKSQGITLTKEQLGIGDLAINHVRFKILEELQPKGEQPVDGNNSCD